MILITGGTGFVGKHLQKELDRRGEKFAVFSKNEYDLTVKNHAEAVFQRYHEANTILHLACYQAAGDFPAKHTGEQFYVNNLIHLNVLESWRKFMPQAKLIAVGSSCGYPSDLDQLTEDKFMDGKIHGSVYSYAFTKRLLLTGITAYNDQFKLNGSYIVPPTLFGEYDDFHIDTAHVCGALIAKFVRGVREDLPEVEIWGDGSQVREFLYVKDFVRALSDLVDPIDRDVLNVGPGKGTSIKELVNLIKKESRFSGKLFFNTARYTGVSEKYLNTDKLFEKYQMRLSPDISEGIRRTVAWYDENFDTLKDKRRFAETAVAFQIT